MKRADLQGAGISFGLHALALALLVLLGHDFTAPAPKPEATSSAHATRVSLLGRATAVRPTGPVVQPVAVRNRGPTRHLAPHADPTEASGEPALDEPSNADAPATQAGAGDDGDLLLGVLNASAAALGGDKRAAREAVAGAQLAVGLPVERRAPNLSGLNARLAAAAEKCWPEAAKRYHQRGEVVVHFCLDSKGALVDSSVLTSSGSSLLDGAAETCVLPGALPAGPEVGAGCFNLPVRFGLEGKTR